MNKSITWSKWLGHFSSASKMHSTICKKFGCVYISDAIVWFSKTKLTVCTGSPPHKPKYRVTPLFFYFDDLTSFYSQGPTRGGTVQSNVTNLTQESLMNVSQLFFISWCLKDITKMQKRKYSLRTWFEVLTNIIKRTNP